MDTQRITDPQPQDEETLLTTLRVGSWDEFRGQEKVKDALQLALKAAQGRKETLEHIMFYGPPGLGKTTLAHIVAREMGVNIRVTSGPALERTGDLAAILTNLEQGDVLFIDEIHRLRRVVEETLYPAMEDYALDIVLGKGPSARTVRLDLPPFTIIGATTQVGKISSPLRDRFGVIHRMEFYKDDELAEIITTAAGKLKIIMDPDAAMLLAARSRKTARIALRLLKRTRDYAQVHANNRVTREVVHKALGMFEVDELGLDAHDRMLLTTMIEKFEGGPVGLSTLAASIAEDETTIEDMYEPFLMRAGLIKRTSKGRVVTKKAYEHLELKAPESLMSLF